MQEITQTTPLFDENGKVQQFGWARHPIIQANLENARLLRPRLLQPLRFKRWDYYGIFTPTHFFAFTLADIGYLGQVFAYIVDLTSGKVLERTLNLPLAKGVKLPRPSDAGIAYYRSNSVMMEFDRSQFERRLHVEWQDFGGMPLTADLCLSHTPHQESMVNVFPMGKDRFFYTRKMHALAVSGAVQLGEQCFTLDPATCFGTQDWGCGLWSYRSFWIWGGAATRLKDGRSAALNLGGGISTDPMNNDNALILDGILHKLGELNFIYNNHHFMKPWQMHDREGRCNLTFTPAIERVAKTDLVVLASEVHQMFGRYDGVVITDRGERVDFRDVNGFAEEHHAKW
ncbi:MAG: DUF2804 domain-containing protein [Anaerolineae bacterium]|nr:DUF2804 domain-containing protein [Anaerolineae bacterium]